MAYNANLPANNSSPVAADIRENFRALKDDGIVTDLVDEKKDPAAGTAGLRTLGTTSVKACAGNDSRLSDQRTPSNLSVAQGKLKTSMGSVNVNNVTANRTLPGGQYGFYPQIKYTNGGGTSSIAWTLGANYYDTGSDSWEKVSTSIFSAGAYSTTITIFSGGASITTYAQQRYVTSSGEIHWVFLKRVG